MRRPPTLFTTIRVLLLALGAACTDRGDTPFPAPPTMTGETVIGAHKDNTLYESDDGSLSSGAGAHLFVGMNGNGQIRRGLVAFDVAGNLPRGAVVTGVSLTLHMSKTIAGPARIELRRVLANWGEGASDTGGTETSGGGRGAASAAGDATWLHAFFDTGFWETPGGDFADAASATTTVDDVEFYTWNSTPELVADVQGWMDDPAPNFGWMLLGNEATLTTAKRFESRDSPNASLRPVLIVRFAPAEEPTAAKAQSRWEIERLLSP